MQIQQQSRFDAPVAQIEALRRVPVKRGQPAEPPAPLNAFSYELPADLSIRLAARLSVAAREGWVKRLWEGDATLWTGSGEERWLGWLNAAGALRRIARLKLACLRLQGRGFTDAVVLGMGGAGLGAQVLASMRNGGGRGLQLHLLDTTDPDQIRQLESGLDLERCLFIVASKSGSTLESRMLAAHFHGRLCGMLGAEEAGSRFIAITDPGSDLHAAALRDGYAAVFKGEPTVGGRYSVLSNFGLVALALQGQDPAAFLHGAKPMMRACSARAAAEANPGMVLGAILGEAARSGRNKATILSCPRLRTFGAWLEQLLAESTGKLGRGIVPVDGEPAGDVGAYGRDRIFIQLRQSTAPDSRCDRHVDALVAAGHPVVRIDVDDVGSLGQEFFRWQVATAVAGAVLGVNPFDQPDVEASKLRTRALVERREASGGYTPARPAAVCGNLSFFGNACGAGATPGELLAAHFGQLEESGYAAILAYLPNNDSYARRLAGWRRLLRDATGAATAGGFGPRYLHSSGQLHKGGPAGGIFLFITADHDELDVPGMPMGFAAIQEAQALGDMEELEARGRPCLRVHLAGSREVAMDRLGQALKEAMSGVCQSASTPL